MATLITANELKKLFKISKSTIYKLVASGEIPGCKIGYSWRFDLEEVKKLVADKKSVLKKGNYVSTNASRIEGFDRGQEYSLDPERIRCAHEIYTRDREKEG